MYLFFKHYLCYNFFGKYLQGGFLMTFQELANELKSEYNNAIKGQKIVMLEVFVIRHAKEIIEQNIKAKDLLHAAELAETMVPEVNRALNLSKYVVLKEEFK